MDWIPYIIAFLVWYFVCGAFGGWVMAEWQPQEVESMIEDEGRNIYWLAWILGWWIILAIATIRSIDDIFNNKQGEE